MYEIVRPGEGEKEERESRRGRGREKREERESGGREREIDRERERERERERIIILQGCAWFRYLCIHKSSTTETHHNQQTAGGTEKGVTSHTLTVNLGQLQGTSPPLHW